VLRGVRKRFANGTLALDGVDLDVADGEFVAIVGPSGCGKTTLLRIVAGLEERGEGSVTVRAAERPGGLASAIVFQGAALFPWLRVRDNVVLALDRLNLSRDEARRRADEQLERVGLHGFGDAFPHQLSGGMQQRAALARAFAVDPEILFLDEPFGALDEQTRVALGAELLRIWDASRKTVLFVTHGIEEALTLADRVVVMTGRPGRVERIVDVPFARPRDVLALRARPEFGALAGTIWEALRPRA
jgi:NitT/TauT family transport system ATP-binding protein